MRRLKVLYLPHPYASHHWQDAMMEAIGGQHDVTIYDHTKPIPEQFKGQEAVVDPGGSVGTRAMYDAATDTRFWQVVGTGLDHVDIATMKTKGFMISYSPGIFSSVALAECAMMYILMLSRFYHEARENFDAGILYQPLGHTLDGAVLGIIGFGASGQDLARRAKPFGMRIQAIDVRPIEPDILDELQPEFLGGPDDMDRVVAESDYLSLHLHVNDETRHIIDARRIGLMKPTACLINVARGALADEDALYEALLDGRIGGAGLDAFAAEPPDPSLPVYKLPNVVVTPHTSGCTDGTARARAVAVAENLDRIAQGLDPYYRVDQ
jgi:D-3-phosphoglycerate dehydrogenase